MATSNRRNIGLNKLKAWEKATPEQRIEMVNQAVARLKLQRSLPQTEVVKKKKPNRKKRKVKLTPSGPRTPIKTQSFSGIDVAPDSNEFLYTYEWRKLRIQAFKKYGNRCQCCGASPQTGAVLNVDHIKPRKYYPSLALDLNNLQILCHDCNHGKGNWDRTDWRNSNQSS